MINPGFFGYFNASRGMLTAQAGINTINHNISNANTPGYSKQRIDQRTMFPFETPQRDNRLGLTGQVGQGVFVQSITRITNTFLDGQIRQENGRNEFQQFKTDILNQVETILGEPSDLGMQNSMQTFFNAAQNLSLNSESLAARNVFIRAAEDMLNVFQQKAVLLDNLRESLVGVPGNAGSVANSQLTEIISQVNPHLEQLASLNQQIVTVLGTGGQPNDLMDQRDLALKQLNSLIDITATETENGQVTISVGTGAGAIQLVNGNRILDTLTVVANPGPTPAPADVPAIVQLASAGTNINNLITTGKAAAIIEAGGTGAGTASVQNVLEQLNTLFDTLATRINTLQTTGRDLSGALGSAEPVYNLAAGSSLAIFRYSTNTDLISNPRLISAALDDSTATGGFAGVSDGRNALAFGQIKQQTFAALDNTGPLDYLTQLVGNVGSAVSQSNRQLEFQQNLLNGLEQQRSQYSGVNVDEEVIDLLRYQRAFEASAKVLKTYDEMTQSILNIIPG